MLSNNPQINDIVLDAETKIQNLVGHPVIVHYKIVPKCTVGQLQQIVADAFSMTWEKVIAPTNHSFPALARQIFTYVGMKYLGLRPTDIQKHIFRERSSIRVSAITIQNLVDIGDPLCMEKLHLIEQKLSAL